MTKKIAWITDTAIQLDEAFIQKHNVHILPLSVVFEDSAFREGIDLTQDEFYNRIEGTWNRRYLCVKQLCLFQHSLLFKQS